MHDTTSQLTVRNFCVIAHIDHGKSTLSDRMLEITGTVEKRNMKAQLLDSMALERERGITIKLAPVKMQYKEHALNLIDTPGHADFGYEVSRSLAAVEGAILLVDATQGVQAQTLATVHAAIAEDLTVIPVVNKIDLPNADPEKVKGEIINLLGGTVAEILSVSGKTGEGVERLLDAVIERIPPPSGSVEQPLRALIFDSIYDTYRGVVAYVRVVDGTVKKGTRLRLYATGKTSDVLEVGTFAPQYTPKDELVAGDTGYIVTGLKDLRSCRVGDTITVDGEAIKPLSGYKEVKPMVYAGFFPQDASEGEELRDAVEKLKLNDAAFTLEPEHSQALGYGFRCGFLGLLHLDIIRERLMREFKLDIVATVPSVGYRVTRSNGESMMVRSAVELPDMSEIQSIEEPWVALDVITQGLYIGAIMQLVQEFRGEYRNTEYLGQGDAGRVILHYHIPLSQILVDFYDRLKSASQGYASLNYELTDYRQADLRRLDVIIAEVKEESLATIVYEDEAHAVGKRIVRKLKDKLPKKNFVIKIQAAIGGKIVAGDRISALRKDVTAKLYGGDVTRKRKLLEKQKKGKKKMASMGAGSVEIPPDAYMAVLKRD
jgi:GTP-binding protein LepA